MINNVNHDDKRLITPMIAGLYLMFLLLQVGFFMAIPYASVTRALVFVPIPSIVITFLLILATSSFTTNRGEVQYRFSWIVLTFVLLNIISLIFIFSRYGSLDSTAMMSFYYGLGIIIYFPMKKMHSVGLPVLDFTKTIGAIGMLSVLIQTAFFNLSGHLLVHSINVAKLQIRSGLRITYYDMFFIFVAAIAVGSILKKSKRIDWVILLEAVAYFYVVSQTRYLEISLALMIVAIISVNLLSQLKGKYISFFNLFFSLPVLIVAGIIAMNMAKKLIAPLKDGSYMSDGSYFARFGELEYYAQAIQGSPIFGLGNFTASVDSIFWTLLHGPYGFYYTQDMGLFGDVARLGFPILVWFVLVVIYVFRKMLHPYTLPLLLLLLMSIGTFSILTNGFIVGMVLAALEIFND